MSLAGLLKRNRRTLPGVTGVARVDRRARDLLRRVGPGDIVILDEIDLDWRTADALVTAGVAGVVNAAPSISGRFPNLGPEALVNAGVTLVDGVGSQVLRTVRDGARVRLHDGVVYVGTREVARGTLQTPSSVAELMAEARAGMSAQLEAFSANTVEFLQRERALILDGIGVPELPMSMEGRQVLVVAPGYGHAEDLGRLRRFVKEYRPVLIGVEGGADALRQAGHTPHVVVGDPREISAETLRCGAIVVVPAQADGYAPGLEHVQDLGVGAVTFPSSANAEDMALLLAEAHGASLVITVGFQATLREFLDRGRSGSNASTFLTRLRLGNKVVDGAAVAALHRAPVSAGAALLLVFAASLSVPAALLLTDTGEVYADLVRDTWFDLVAWIRGLFT